NLAKLGTTAEIQQAIGTTHRFLSDATGDFQTSSLSLPYGVWPKQTEAVYRGEFEGTEYRYESVVLVGAEPAPSPHSVEFRPLETPRIRASGDQWDLWFGEFEDNPSRRYVSDGDPDTITVPASLAGELDEESVAEDRRVSYLDE
ncbi:MAG: hypothetical protein ACLFS8_07655, partial [Clostridia bacterium]